MDFAQLQFHSPYDNNHRTVFSHMRNKSGVYIIFENDTCVYIGSSGSCVYRACFRHFQKWTDKQYRITYKDLMSLNSYTISIIETQPVERFNLERILIQQCKPRDNRIFYDDFVPENDFVLYEEHEAPF